MDAFELILIILLIIFVSTVYQVKDDHDKHPEWFDKYSTPKSEKEGGE